MTNLLGTTANLNPTAELITYTALVITADKGLASTIEHTLSAMSVACIGADSMPKAAQAIQGGLRPIAIVIDLSAEHALKFIKEVKSHHKFSQIPLLVMTADPSLPEVKLAIEAGANRWLTKAFVGTTLVGVIRQFSVL